MQSNVYDGSAFKSPMAAPAGGCFDDLGQTSMFDRHKRARQLGYLIHAMVHGTTYNTQ